MPHVVNTDALLAEGILTRPQVDEIIRRSRETMLALVVNVVLCAGIIAASLGFVFWIADALGVALLGLFFLAVGLTTLIKAGDLYRMLGHAATLVGAGMLIAGGSIELVDKLDQAAQPILILAGGAIAALSAFAFHKGPSNAAFSVGAIMLMGLAAHLTGAFLWLDDYFNSGKLFFGDVPMTVFSGYAALALAAAGTLLNVRFVTALAIVPFAQMLSTGTAYFHAAYVFYSPEPTLTILQMAALIAVMMFTISRTSDRIGRHAGILAIMAAVVGNLAFLVGSLWGDEVGLSFYRGEGPNYDDFDDWQAYRDAYDAWKATFFVISEHVFSAVWAILLIAGAWLSAVTSKRGLFNASVTFLGIHAYTQMFESFSDEPMVYALGGLAAIPLAWGLWRLNQKMFSPPAIAAE